MCLAVPARVIEVHADELATVAIDGVTSQVSIALLDSVAPGDYVIVHVGFAINKLDVDEAERSLALIAELAASTEAEGRSDDALRD